MKRKLVAFSIWIIFTVVTINAIWFFVFLTSSTLDLDTLIPTRENIHVIFLSLSFGIVILATLLNIALNLTLMAGRQVEGEKHKRQRNLTARQLYSTGAMVIILVVILISLDYYNKYQERMLIINCVFRTILYHRSAANLTTYSGAKFTTIPGQTLPVIPLESLPDIPGKFFRAQKSGKKIG